MNKFQKFIAKVFKIKTTVNNYYYNDPSKCQDAGVGLDLEQVKRIVMKTLNSTKENSEISLGVNINANEIYFRPLGDPLADCINDTKYKTEIVIVINEI